MDCDQYLDDEILDKLTAQNRQTCNGYLILIDIINSTYRKKEFKGKWQLQTEAIYKSFSKMVDKIKNKILPKSDYVLKFSGDGAMVFFKYSDTCLNRNDEAPKKEISISIIQEFILYLEYIYDKKDYLGDIKLKSVISYLTNIALLKNIHNKGDDVLGRGIDFCFRLEKYASCSHIVINEMMKNSLSINDFLELNKIRYDFVECVKKIKGWDGTGEKFFLFTNISKIKESIEYIKPSIYEENVNLELIIHILSKNNSEEKDDRWE